MATGQICSIGALEPESEDWLQYKDRIEQFFIANDISTEEKKRAVFLSVCGKETCKLIGSLLAPAKPSAASFEEICAKLDAHWDPKPRLVLPRRSFGPSIRSFFRSFLPKGWNERLASHPVVGATKGWNECVASQPDVGATKGWNERVASQPDVGATKGGNERGALKTALFDSSIKPDSSAQPMECELQMDQTFSDSNIQVRKMELGPAGASGAEEKVIMIVGETGSGKTTLINAMVNYIYGIQFEDDYRFRIITDPKEKGLQTSQSMSQTQWVTSYTFHHCEGSQQPYTFTLVDTPGFGDTGGIVNDKKIVDRIREFFSSKSGIDHLDAVGFVVPSSVARLTPTQRYVFDSILSLFGKDIGDSIYVLITFADANVPPVLESLKEAGVKHNMHVKFNNSAVFAKRQADNPMSQMFNKMFWDMGMLSFQSFFNHLRTMKPQSLTLTKDVLSERQRLQTHLMAVKAELDQGLSKLNQLEHEISVIKNHQSDLDRNKDFTYTVVEDRAVKEEIPSGTYITNCLTCNRTCHYPCTIPDDNDKAGCAAMTNGKCHVCKSGCAWSVHKNMKYRIVIVQETVEKTAEDLKNRYRDAEGKLLPAKQLAQKVYEEYLGTKANVMDLIKECKKCLKRLQEIALKPDPLSDLDYIDKLIEAEQMNRKDGYNDRIHQLQGIRELAACGQDLQKDELIKVMVDQEEKVYQKFRDFLEKPSPSYVIQIAGGFMRVGNSLYCSVSSAVPRGVKEGLKFKKVKKGCHKSDK